MMCCFGFSWPIAVIKNIKARTAKSMSLPFILLVLLGYAAGIVAKFISGNTGYVLIIYFVNVASVTVNLVVYFVNLRYDRKSKHENV